MIKNLIYITFGIYLEQEYKHILPNIRNHSIYINQIILNNNLSKFSKRTANTNCPIIKYIFNN